MFTKKIIALLVMMTACGAYAQSTKLVFVKGSKYEVSTTSKVNSTFNVMGQDMENNIDNETRQTIEVKDIRGNETDLTAVTTRIIANIQSMGQDMSYDSDKKDNSGQLAEAMGGMIGKVKNITLDGSGKIVKQDKMELEGNMGAMLGASNNGIALLQVALIGKELKVGNTWYDSSVVNEEKMKNTTAGNYTITNIDNATGTATITFNGNQSTQGTIEQMGMEMGMSSTSKLESKFEIDIKTGLIKSSNISSNGNANIEAQGMSIPGTTKATTLTTIKLL